jgi:hypothetical protein
MTARPVLACNVDENANRWTQDHGDMDIKTVAIKQTIEVINRMEADGVIGPYALHPIPRPQERHRTALRV